MKKWVDAARLDVVSLVALRALGCSQNQLLTFGVIIWRGSTLTEEFRNPIVRHVSDRNSVTLRLKVAQTGPERTAMVRRVEYHSTCSKDNFVRKNEESGHQDARPKEDAEGTRAFAQRENVADRMLCSSDKYLSLALLALLSVPADIVKTVRDAFLKMADDPEGLKVLVSSMKV